MKYVGIRWLTGAFPRSVDLFELSDLAPTTIPRIVQHQVLNPNGQHYGIATCTVVADESTAILDYAPFPETNLPAMMLGATELRLERSSGRLSFVNVKWRGLGEDSFEDAEFEPYVVQNRIPAKTRIDGAQNDLLKAATELTEIELAEKLPTEGNMPAKILVTSTAYVRNPFVVEAALRRAGGICGDCKENGPFLSARTGRPYLEVHHKIPLSRDGTDSLENTIALCPNCHRKRHYELLNGAQVPAGSSDI